MQRNKNKEHTLLLVDILREVFRYVGIEFKSCTFIHWRVIDDHIIPRVIVSVSDLLREFRDDSYQLTLTNVTISRIEKQPFTVPEITVELAYENNQCSRLRIFNDYEEFGPEYDTAEALHDRLQRITEAFKVALSYISVIMEIVKALRTMFGS